MLVFVASNLVELKAARIPLADHSVSSTPRGMIEKNASFFARLSSWLEFPSDSVTFGNLAEESIPDLTQFRAGFFHLRTGFPLIAGWFRVDASDSYDPWSSASSVVPPVYAADLTLSASFGNPVALLCWRCREFLRIPGAPCSGLFRPPRQPVLNSTISSLGVEWGVFPDDLVGTELLPG